MNVEEAFFYDESPENQDSGCRSIGFFMRGWLPACQILCCVVKGICGCSIESNSLG